MKESALRARLCEPVLQRKPSFVIADPRTIKAPQVPSISDPAVTVWCNRRGVLGALSHIVDKEHWLHILGVASYKLDVAGNAVLAVPWERATQEAINDEFQRTVWPTFLQIQGWEVLHGSAVISARGVIAFCASSETGKSTLAYGLGLRGYALWADDAVVVKILPHSVQTLRLPFFVRLRSASARYFGSSEGQINRGRMRCETPQKKSALPLTTICLLEQAQSLSGNRAVTIQPLSAAEAVVGVLDHALYFSLQDQKRKRRMMQQYLTLVGQVSVFKVCVSRGLERLPPVLDELERRILAG
jgi:hypothetical protein